MRLFGGEHAITATIRAIGLGGLLLAVIAVATKLLTPDFLVQGIVAFVLTMWGAAGLDRELRGD